METKGLRDFLEIPYDELEVMNLRVKEQRLRRESPDKLREERIKYLTDEKRIKAVTVA
ncbi:MAG TPA: glutamine synthetase, partial [Hyalangium sp.]|nr:glutamine synthetase [Hyalangium sp.]